MTHSQMRLKWDASGLLPVVLQDENTGRVLMLGYMNKTALKLTLETRKVHFWSRSRNTLWLKGETSGNYHEVVEVALDCDGDALLVRVNPAGPTCHTGQTSCFHNPLDAVEVLDED
jgi:phosphoribosyl-AMP cyclohydrolase / phosphoribosyl-ATP pyrophosphohydrolase